MVRIKHHLTRKETVSKTALITSITWNRERIRIPTGESVFANEWDVKKSRVKITALNKARALGANKRLVEKENAIEAIYYDYINANNGELPTKATFHRLLDQRFGKKPMAKLNLFEYFADYIARTKNGLRVTAKGSIIKASKAKHYNTTLQKLKEFQKETTYKIDFDTISLDFYTDFTKWLRRQKLSENYVGVQIQNLKSVLNEATEKGYNKNMAYKSRLFVKTAVEVDTVSLTKDELTDLLTLQLDNRLSRVRDLFLVGCYTGLRFSDFSRLAKDNIKDGFIHIKQQKTGGNVAVPIHKIVKDIWAKYEGDLPTKISAVKMNAYLKEVCAEAKTLQVMVNKTSIKGGVAVNTNHPKSQLVTTHTARRTFATNAYKDGIPTITIMAITGHKTEKSFLKYIRVTPTEHAKIMQTYWAKENNLKAV